MQIFCFGARRGGRQLPRLGTWIRMVLAMVMVTVEATWLCYNECSWKQGTVRWMCRVPARCVGSERVRGVYRGASGLSTYLQFAAHSLPPNHPSLRALDATPNAMTPLVFSKWLVGMTSPRRRHPKRQLQGNCSAEALTLGRSIVARLMTSPWGADNSRRITLEPRHIACTSLCCRRHPTRWHRPFRLN